MVFTPRRVTRRHEERGSRSYWQAKWLSHRNGRSARRSSLATPGDPSNYALWWDAETYAIEPAGRAVAGQRIFARTRALGKDWELRVTIAGIDADERIVDLTTQLPFGITVPNQIV